MASSPASPTVPSRTSGGGEPGYGPPAAIEARRLSRRFGRFQAVDDVSFRVERGEIFGFLGSNGAGKSTTIRMLCGLLEPSGGTALVDGVDVGARPEVVKQRIGYMSQRFSLYEKLTVDQNIRFFGGIYGLSGERLQRRRQFVLDMAELSGRERQLTSELSGGWRQRLALGCAILHEPSIVFLDEPTGGVDPLARRQFWRLIEKLAADGVTILVTTHYLDEAEHCQRLLVINAGKVAAMGSVPELKAVFADRPIVEVASDTPVAVMSALDRRPEVEKTSVFGTAVHAVLRHRQVGHADVAAWLAAEGILAAQITDVPPSLEDVFLDVVERSNADVQGPAPARTDRGGS